MPKPNKDASEAAAVVRTGAIPLTDDHGVAPMVATVDGASLVLIGEASHGTHDFYAWRAEITRALIAERGFMAVAIEGDWPDAYRVNRHVRHADGMADAAEALAGFERFPTWMWRNTAVMEFVRWLREHNGAEPEPARRAGFYGLDLYSLHASMRAVIEYLERHDRQAARAAKTSYGCFEEFGDDTESYAWAAGRLAGRTCEDAVTAELVALRTRRAEFLRRDGRAATDEYFYAEQNARLAQNAERYYRTMFRGRTESWNVRDRHMAETLEELREHLITRGQAPKLVVWAHNSHVGDARATEPGEDGELNLGQLVRERHGNDAKLIGFTTHAGTVMAASDWGEAGRVRTVRPALGGSHEELFHATGLARFFLPLAPGTVVHLLLTEPRLERAIGVIYRPQTERWSHYYHARLANQFDAIIHIDQSRAVEPLEQVTAWEPAEEPETFPSGV